MNAASAVRERSFMPTFSIFQLRSKEVKDLGAGNMTTFKKVVDQLIKRGIRHICLQPIHETSPGMASLFSRTSMNALSHRVLDLAEIPEIKGSRRLSADLRKTLTHAEGVTAGSKTNLGLVEVEHPAYLRRAFMRFAALPEDAARKQESSAFCKENSWWLDKYAYFKALEASYGAVPMEQWDKAYADMESTKAKAFIRTHQNQINYFKYVQMETYRQVKEALSYAKAQGMEEVEALVGVGVARQSAEGFLMPEMFDFTRQIGCFPEPENGYPIQLWGFLAEKDNDALLEFKVRSFQALNALGINRIGIDHACGFLGGYTTFPVYDPTLMAQGEYRVLKADNPNDAEAAEAGGRWVFKPGEEEAERKAFAKKVLFALLERVPGMKFTAETVGDKNRREASEGAIAAAIEAGHDLTLMRALPWETTPLREYEATDRLSHTHDMPALTGLLTGKAGDHSYGWIDGDRVSSILARLGILAPKLNGPIDVSKLSTEFMAEIYKRVVAGSGAGTVVVPLSALYTLTPEHLDAEKWQYTNIQPGTSGEVNNPMGNWEQRLPEIEDLATSGEVIARATSVESRPFGEVITLHSDTFQTQIKKVEAESVSYQAANGNWTVWQPTPGINPLMEMAVTYTGPEITKGFENKAWTKYAMYAVGFDRTKEYVFYDLVSGEKHSRHGSELIAQEFSVGLNTATKEEPNRNRHHFVIYEAVA
ncbi:MAG: 4-alpha-glucanotransferase [Candidatus Saganbacteria bacterium]|nr:4-alpha-glucanotransferase [Candidatus Saganbacteria bacterium]